MGLLLRLTETGHGGGSEFRGLRRLEKFEVMRVLLG